MATTIITKNSTSGNAPADGDLSVGELAIDLTNKQLYTKNSGGVIKLGGSGNSGEWEVNGSDIYYDTGNVGVGTDNPQENLEITAGSSNAISAKIDGSLGKLSVGTRSNQSGFRYDIKHDRSVGSAIHSVGSNGSIDALTIDSTGNVGIGTSGPSEALTVSGSGTSARISLTDSDSVRASMTGLLEFDGTDNRAGFIGYDAGDMSLYAAVGDIKLSTGGSEAMRIDSSGNVGLGTSELTDSYKMIVQGADQETANITDSGDHGATLFLRATGQEVGSGGAIAFGTTFGNKRPFAAIKSIVNNGTGNSTGHLAFSTRSLHTDTALTERMRITQGGNLGIGTNTPVDKLHVYGDDSNVINVKVENADATGTYKYMAMGYGGSGEGIPSIWQSSGYIEAPNNLVLGSFGNPIKFYTNSSRLENMRLDTTGNLLIGKTSPDFSTEGIALYSSSDANGSRVNITNTANKVVNLNRLSDNGIILQFYKDGVSVGSISTNANSLPSDRNFKKNIKDLQLGLGFVSALNPVTYNYKRDDESDPVMTGLIAQDVEDTLKEFGVEPNSMTLLQYKPVEDEKESDYQMDYSKLIPVLTKAIQELSGQVDELKAEVAALKGA